MQREVLMVWFRNHMHQATEYISPSQSEICAYCIPCCSQCGGKLGTYTPSFQSKLSQGDD